MINNIERCTTELLLEELERRNYKVAKIGDDIIVLHPWIARLSILVIFMIGVIVGVSISYFSALHFVDVVGQSFKVESVNTTISINQSMIMDAIEHINQTRG